MGLSLLGRLVLKDPKVNAPPYLAITEIPSQYTVFSCSYIKSVFFQRLSTKGYQRLLKIRLVHMPHLLASKSGGDRILGLKLSFGHPHKVRYSEKATTFEKKSPIIFDITWERQKNSDTFFKFCGLLLRISEL